MDAEDDVKPPPAERQQPLPDKKLSEFRKAA
jgi:hypothetical protein